MSRPINAVFALCIFAGASFAQAPAPAAVVNPASNTPAGLPNSGIAQGSIFVVYGANMGPTTLAQAPSLPLPTTAGLSGTSVQVTVAGTTVTAAMVYTLATQVAAVLPSTTPVGTGTLTVTYNGQSGSTPIQVVQSNFGISTVNQTGAGPGVVTRPDYSVITVTNSAKPGETLVLWGTGLGPVSGNDAVVPTGGDLGTPVQVYVGGQLANVTYRGRSAAPGLDQINFVMPNVSGCYVSLVVQTKNTVSNFTTVPVAAGGGTCSDSTGLSISTLAPALSGGAVRIGGVTISQVTSTTPAIGPLPASTRTAGGASATFYKFTSSQLSQSGSFTGQPSIGGCLISTYNSANTRGVPTFNATPLNAGASIGVTGPLNFTMSQLQGQVGIYSASLQGSIPGGTYTASNGTGGADVGGFNATIQVGTPLTWTNQASVTTVDRTQPFQVTWTGGDPSGFVIIGGTSSVLNGTAATGATFICTAPVSAGQFSIPVPVLLSLPASTVSGAGGFSIPTGSMSVGSYSTPAAFTASGLDYAYTVSGSTSLTLMTYN